MKKVILLAITLSTTILFWCTKMDSLLWWNTTWDNQTITKTEYENKEHNFTFTLPEWRTFKEKVFWSTMILFSPKTWDDDTSENISINVNPILSWWNLEELYKQNKTTLSQTISWVVFLDEQNLTIDNNPAKKITYTFKWGKYEIQQTQYIALDGNKSYVISYIALKDTFNNFQKDLDKIVSSFKF